MGEGWDWSNQLKSSNDIPWLESSGLYMSSGELQFDPKIPNKLYQAAGVGVWETTIPEELDSNVPIVWNSMSRGIEQLVTNEIIAPPGGSPIVASWDRPFFTIDDVNSYPERYDDGEGGSNFSMGWNVDYASMNPNVIVGISDYWGREHSGVSTDGGQTWAKFAGQPTSANTSIGGSIAASTAENYIWAPANGGTPAYTQDGGDTWTDITLPEHSGEWGGFHWAHYLNRTNVAADREAPNTFYLYDSGQTLRDGGTEADNGLWRTEDGGTTWDKVHDGQIAPWSYYNTKIEAVPGSEGELFFSGGPVGDSNVMDDSPFMHSTDGGTTWEEVAGIDEVFSFGFGKAATEGGPATVNVVGYYDGDFGIWQSQDNAKNWTKIGETPMGSLDVIKTISGDMDNDNVYIGTGGSGAIYWSGQDGIF